MCLLLTTIKCEWGKQLSINKQIVSISPWCHVYCIAFKWFQQSVCAALSKSNVFFNERTKMNSFHQHHYHHRHRHHRRHSDVRRLSLMFVTFLCALLFPHDALFFFADFRMVGDGQAFAVHFGYCLLPKNWFVSHWNPIWCFRAQRMNEPTDRSIERTQIIVGTDYWVLNVTKMIS